MIGALGIYDYVEYAAEYGTFSMADSTQLLTRPPSCTAWGR